MNPYWKHVKDHVCESRWAPGYMIRNMYTRGSDPNRWECQRRYTWTVTDPATVGFVLDHCGERVIDPIAGNAYWAALLQSDGRDVQVSDLHPPSSGTNYYYEYGDVSYVHEWIPVKAMDAVEAVEKYLDRTLFLSWPDYDESTGEDIIRAYPGDRVVYVGEPQGGCCGTDGMFQLLEKEWVLVAEHTPIQWDGIHDTVRVYDRRVK